jgi:thioredoxin 1
MKLLKFYAVWCGPCKTQSQIIKQAGDKITVKVEDVNIDDNVFMSTNFNIRSVPTMVLVEDGTEKEIKRHVGVMKEAELIEWLSS